jgi:hypothetical protein
LAPSPAGEGWGEEDKINYLNLPSSYNPFDMLQGRLLPLGRKCRILCRKQPLQREALIFSSKLPCQL